MTTGPRSLKTPGPRLMLSLALAWATVAAAAAPREVTTFAQLFSLNQKDAAAGIPVRFRAVVLCYDPGWGQFYVSDGTSAQWFSPARFQQKFAPGELVELVGNTEFVRGFPALTNLQARVVDHRELPPAKPLALPDFAKDFGQWVETSGRVRVAETSWGRLALVIESGGQSCLVYVMGPPPAKDWKRFIGCLVRLRGINGSKIEKNRLVKATLFVPGLNEVKVVEAATFDPRTIPVAAIDKLLNRELGAWTNNMVHVNGTISPGSTGGWVEVRDPTGIIRAHVVQMTRVQQNQRVDLWGYPVLSPSGFDLKDAYFEVMNPVDKTQANSPADNAMTQSNTHAPLTLVSEIFRLSKKEAATHIPVRLHGVITFADTAWRNTFFSDATGEVYVETDQQDLRPGQWVELIGHASPGGFANEVVASAIHILGVTNLPEPAKVGLEDLATGSLDAHWVEIEGVVRRVSDTGGHINLTITTPKGQFRAVVPNTQNAELPGNLIDALVRIRGACGAQLNRRGQLIGIVLHVPSLAQVQIIEAPPPDPFAVPTTSIAAVATFDPERLAGRRVKIGGVVTLVLPGRGFFTQDRTEGIWVGTTETADVHAGDSVEVLGFVAMGDFSPHLDEAIVRRKGAGRLRPPRYTTAEQILVQGTNDAVRVRLEAQLVQNAVASARPKLVLQNGSILFTATLESPVPGRQFPSWKAGSVIQLTGICTIQATEAHEPDSFRLLVADLDDAVLLASPPWWTTRYTLMLAGGMTFVIGAALGWVVLLRRQVRAQTDLIQQSHKELLETSRQAGMAEVATSVLHNVGNVLTGVTVTSTLMAERVKQSKVDNLLKALQLLHEHQADLPAFLKEDPRGQRLPEYLNHLAEHLANERTAQIDESVLLQRNIEHIRDIVAMQQNYARVVGVVETLQPADLLEDALRINERALNRHGVRVRRQIEGSLPRITTEKNRVLQILVNLIQNAKYACSETGRTDREICASITQRDGKIKFSIADNGVGIPPENLTRIFNHGFTTRRSGHGFGLHSGALAANELGGSLQVHSGGIGQGATFTLELPISKDTLS